MRLPSRGYIAGTGMDIPGLVKKEECVIEPSAFIIALLHIVVFYTERQCSMIIHFKGEIACIVRKFNTGRNGGGDVNNNHAEKTGCQHRYYGRYIEHSTRNTVRMHLPTPLISSRPLRDYQASVQQWYTICLKACKYFSTSISKWICIWPGAETFQITHRSLFRRFVRIWSLNKLSILIIVLRLKHYSGDR